MKNLLKRFYTMNEIFRLVFMLGLIAVLFYPDFAALKTISYVLGVFLSITFIAHITRKYALFNYIDMKELVTAALDKGNTAAAIIFASVCAVIIVCITTAAQFFVR